MKSVKIIYSAAVVMFSVFYASADNLTADNGGVKKSLFAAGCFWGVEYRFEQIEGVLDAVSGYSGGTKADPSYSEVSSGKTGHAETVEVVYDSRIISYEELVRFFFTIHDFTFRESFNPGFISPYRSAIFYRTENERKTAEKIIREFEEKGFNVKTELSPAESFWKAEDYHQNYYRK